MKVNQIRGFTLIEAIVTVAIIGILASIAYPLFESQARKGRRTEAIDNLTQIQILLERCYADNGGYNCCQPVINNFLNPPAPQPSRVINYNYNFVSTNNGGFLNCKRDQGYTMTATINNTQTDDLQCQSFTIDHLGNRTAIDNDPSIAVPPIPRQRPACWTD